MLQDDLFKGKDDYMIDECLTFMLAATMTTTLLISNAVYYLTACPEKLAKLRSEIKRHVKSSCDHLDSSDWKKILLEDELLSGCNYLGFCVAETLRIDPSLRFSTIHEISGDA